MVYDVALVDTMLTFVMAGEGSGVSSGIGKVTSNPFEIDSSTGAVTIGDTGVLYTDAPTYFLTITATTPYSERAIYCTFKVEVNDANDAPSIADETWGLVSEDASKKTIVIDGLNSTDNDFGQAILFSIDTTMGDGDMGHFSISACGGQVYVATDELNYKTKNFYSLYVVATDDGEPAMSDYGWVYINVTDVNEAPTFSAPEQNFTIPENTLNATASVGVRADDPDGDDVRFSISTDVYNYFKIDPITGQFGLKKNVVLDYEDVHTYSGKLRAFVDQTFFLELLQLEPRHFRYPTSPTPPPPPPQSRCACPTPSSPPSAHT